MEEGFSGTVRISNISDFIAPSAGAVKISLNDCLACSGCITSAETVLVEEQSLTRLLEGMSSKQLSVITVCPQSVCSIAVKRQIPVSQAAQLIASYFFSKGAHYVVDSTFGRFLCLEEAYHEFQSRSTRPLLVSSCPGFVCYAEKSHEAFLLPFISKVRSPQAVTGALVKDYLSRSLNVPVESIYHAAVMPCFDKKLEASRPDFHVPGTTDVRETDCVISTGQSSLQTFLISTLIILDIVMFQSNVTLVYACILKEFSTGTLAEHQVALQKCWSEDMFPNMAGKLRKNGCKFPNSEKHGLAKISSSAYRAKNLDVLSVHRNDSVILRAARVYGFRNIQNLVRKMKNNKNSYDYVEVQACPNGCGNGGAQIRGETTEEREQILSSVEKNFASIQEDATSETQRITSEWNELNPGWRKLLYTDYHSVTGNIAQKLQW
ncbi:unnamed protein product [Haemonchus placei]|uniref:Fe_hyd_lg_C domain-containing protein n=1 Tax=Haemonchus placei TaxID=6290 RepID=A0A0N4W327_HAEPC|nr:unnamed protein product [Haemonchus placei]